MRALFVNENIGGHATLHHHLRRALAAGHPDVEADVYDVPPRGPLRRVLQARVPGLDRLDLDLQQIRFQVAQSAHVTRVLRSWPEPYDVLHLYSQNVALTSVARMRTVPSVVGTDVTSELHAYYLPYRRPTRFTPSVLRATSVLERRVYDAATIVVAQSEWAADSLRASYGVEDERLRVIPYGILLPEVLPERRAADRPRLTFVGTPWAGKGGDRLLEIWRARFRERTRLTFVTRDAVPVEPGVDVVRDLRQGDERLWEILGSTDVFVFPSAVDKSSFAVLEAMAAGVPVVICDVAAMSELVGDSEAGVVVQPGDDIAVGDAIERLLDDDALRTRMGAAARTRAMARFDARATTAAVVEVLREAVRAHR